MKNKDRFVHNLRLDFHMTQRTLAPVRFSDGLTGLERFVDELKSQLDGDAILHGLSDYQLLLAQRQSSELKGCVEAAVQQTAQSLDRIVREARRAFALQTKDTEPF